MKVKFYSTIPADDGNVLLGISPKIPAVVVPDDALTDETYRQMTEQEFIDYQTLIASDYEAWHVIQSQND